MKKDRLIKLNDGRKIGDFQKPYIVAELNTSHFGNILLAKKMILKAKQSGCDCVKFQSWSSGTLYSKNFLEKNLISKLLTFLSYINDFQDDDINILISIIKENIKNLQNLTSKKFFDKYSLDNIQLKKLAIYSKKIGISFSSTPYSEEEVNFLVNECDPAFIKIASMDLNNHLFLKFIAQKKTPVVLSTGMGTFKEIESAIRLLVSNGKKNICILHCVSMYPLDPKIANLKNITMLRKKFKSIPIGYSDHSLGITLPISSIALGACLVEKHFTLDNKKIGMDNHMAIEPDEMRKLTSESLITFNSLGVEKRILSKKEYDQRKKMRRSIFAQVLIKKNEKITLKKIILRRPGNGISLDKMSKILGRRVKRNIKKNSLLKMSDIII